MVLFDDDAVFAAPGRSRFLDFAAAAELHVASPAIRPGSPASHMHTLARPFRTVRRVDWVEVGPVVGLSPSAVRHVLPFPLDARMGWGIDVDWAVTGREHGWLLGLVDATPVRHLGPVGVEYATDEERETLQLALERAGVGSVGDLIGLGPVWRPWQRKASWVISTGRG